MTQLLEYGRSYEKMETAFLGEDIEYKAGEILASGPLQGWSQAFKPVNLTDSYFLGICERDIYIPEGEISFLSMGKKNLVGTVVNGIVRANVNSPQPDPITPGTPAFGFSLDNLSTNTGATQFFIGFVVGYSNNSEMPYLVDTRHGLTDTATRLRNAFTII